jgi:hypothetical protein
MPRAAETRAFEHTFRRTDANTFTVTLPILPACKPPSKWSIGTDATRNSRPAIPVPLLRSESKLLCKTVGKQAQLIVVGLSVLPYGCT